MEKVSLRAVQNCIGSDDYKVLQKLNISPEDLQTKSYLLKCSGEGNEEVKLNIGMEYLEGEAELVSFRNQALGNPGGLLYAPYSINFSTVEIIHIYDFVNHRYIAS